MQFGDDLAIFLGRRRRVARVPGVGVGEVLVPVVVHPRRPRTTAAIHVHLDAAGDQHAVSGQPGLPRVGLRARQHRRAILETTGAGPQSEDADGKTALAQQLLVQLPLRLANAGILRAGHAFLIEVFDDLDQPQLLLIARQRGYQAAHQAHRRFLHDAGRRAVGAAIDGAGRRVFGVLAHLGHLHGVGVGHAVVSRGVRQPHRVVRGHRVEVGGGEVALLGVLALVPSAPPHPLTGLQAGDVVRHPFLRLGDRFDRGVAEVDGEQGIGFGEMDVAVDQPRRDRPAAKVDHLGDAADARLDLIGGADRGDPAAGDGHRLRHRVAVIDRQDAAVDQDEVGGNLRVRGPLASQ